jgi:hypothetical protein
MPAALMTACAPAGQLSPLTGTCRRSGTEAGNDYKP